MPKTIALLRATCSLVLSGLGIVMAANEAWAACVCVALVAWDDRPDIFRRKA